MAIFSIDVTALRDYHYEKVNNSHRGASVTGACLRRVATGAVLAVLTTLLAAPPPTMAQTCTSTPSVTGTPADTPSTWVFSDTYTSGIDCEDLTGGLTLTVEADAKLGTADTPISTHAINLDSLTDGDNDITIINSGTIHTTRRAIRILHDGAGAMKVEHKAGKLVGTGLNSIGISANHRGKENTATDGIHIVSNADIELSDTDSTSRLAIFVTTLFAEAGTTVPITIDVTGGTIRNGNPISGTPNPRGSSGTSGIIVDQYTKGKVAINIAGGAMIDSRNRGIWVDFDQDKGEGDITITNSGRIVTDHYGVGVHHHSVGRVRVAHSAGGRIETKTANAWDSGINVYYHGTAREDKEGDARSITIESAGDIESANFGILARAYNLYQVDKKIPISVHVQGGKIDAGHHGIYAATRRFHPGPSDAYTPDSPDDYMKVRLSPDLSAEGYAGGEIKVTVDQGATVTSKRGDGIHVEGGAVTITNSGEIVADLSGIQLKNRTVGKIKVMHNAGGRIETKNANEMENANEWNSGINLFYEGNAREDGEGDARSIEIVSAGDITSASRGILARAYNQYQVDKKIPISVHVQGGKIDAGHHGIYAATRRYDSSNSNTHTHSEYAGGEIKVTVDHGATVISKRDGIHVDGGLLEGEMRAQTVTVRGEVEGGTGEYAGVHMVKGGTVVVGPQAHVCALSDTAIKANAPGDMVVILEKDRNGLVGHVEGKILNAATTIFKTRVGATGAAMDLSVGDTINTRIAQEKGIYDTVNQTTLETITGGYEFKEQPLSRFYHDRARVYEALPSVLLDLNGHVPYRTAQTVVTHAGDGVGSWARIVGGDGRRRMDQATTSKGYLGKKLAWDLSHYGIEAGIDFPDVDKPLQLGLSLHHRQGQAVVKDGGKIEVSATGVGVSAMFRNETGLYMDGRLSYTGFHDIDMNSSERGTLDSDFSGMGYGVDVEGGKRMALKGMDGVTLTPRGGLSWSSVDIDDFDDLAGVQDSGRVSLGSATSLKGRFGILAETGFGGLGPGRDGRLFASLDVEHEFSSDRNVMASGTKLSSEAEATWGHFRLGGTASWNNSVMGMVTLSGEGFYATAGDGNTDLGAAITLSLRF